MDSHLVDDATNVVVVGHSWGGLVAIEIARSLQAAGVATSHLVLLDSSEPDQVPARGLRQHCRRFASRLRHAHRWRALPTDVAEETPDSQDTDLDRASLIAAKDRAYYLHMNARFGHKLKSLAIETILVRTGVVADEVPTSLWRNVFLGPFEIIPAAGRHTSMLSEPFVDTLGANLRNALLKSGKLTS